MHSLYRRVESKFAATLTPEFARPGESLRVQFDFDAVEALASGDAAAAPRSAVAS